MSQMMKVYNVNGSEVGSFRLPSIEQIRAGHPTLKQMIVQLNLRNHFVKRQLGKDGKPARTYVTKEMSESLGKQNAES